jgi:enoyl-CoA hydratase
MADEVLCQKSDDGVALITLNRPEAMNALSNALVVQLCEIVESIENDSGVRVAVITGAGDRAFSAGIDLKELGGGTNNLEQSMNADARRNAALAIMHSSKPYIGAINGVAVTGGLELALVCDMLIASSTARFADTHAIVGLMPGWGLSQILPRKIGAARAKEMSLLGRFIDAQTACDWGLVNRVVEPERLLNETLDLARAIAANDPNFVQAYSAFIDEGLDLPLAEALELERRRGIEYLRTVDPASIEARRTKITGRGRKQS